MEDMDADKVIEQTFRKVLKLYVQRNMREICVRQIY